MAVKQFSDANPDGVCIGQSATDKVGFYGAAPVARPAAITDATSGDAHTRLNDLIAKLELVGLLTPN